MIYEKDLDESIARYQGETNPSIETCRKLAACLIVKRELFGEQEQPTSPAQYSYAPAPAETTIQYDSGTEFAECINGRKPEDIWPIMDELMDTIHALMPRLYDGVMMKLA